LRLKETIQAFPVDEPGPAFVSGQPAAFYRAGLNKLDQPLFSQRAIFPGFGYGDPAGYHVVTRFMTGFR
jgi:hypothetical protein